MLVVKNQKDVNRANKVIKRSVRKPSGVCDLATVSHTTPNSQKQMQGGEEKYTENETEELSEVLEKSWRPGSGQITVSDTVVERN